MVATIVGSRRWPCCGRHLRVDFGPGRIAERRCRVCKRTFKFYLVPAYLADRMGGDVWRLEHREVAEAKRAGRAGGYGYEREEESPPAPKDRISGER